MFFGRNFDGRLSLHRAAHRLTRRLIPGRGAASERGVGAPPRLLRLVRPCLSTTEFRYIYNKDFPGRLDVPSKQAGAGQAHRADRRQGRAS